MLITFSARALISIWQNLPLMIPEHRHHCRQMNTDTLLAWEPRDLPIVPKLFNAFPFQQLHAASLMWNCSAHMLIPIFTIPAIPTWEIMWDFFWVRRRCLFFCRPEIFSFLKQPRNGPLVYLREILGSHYPVKTWSCSNTYLSSIASYVL